MGSSKETTGFPQGTHRLPRGFTLIPGIEQNEKNNPMVFEPIVKDLTQVRHSHHLPLSTYLCNLAQAGLAQS